MLYLCNIAIKFTYASIWMHRFVMYSTTSTETLPSRLHSTTSTYLANTKLEILKHYYTGYTTRITDLACTQL
jgi:hypothetical protein